jgi:hypothetical protein
LGKKKDAGPASSSLAVAWRRISSPANKWQILGRAIFGGSRFMLLGNASFRLLALAEIITSLSGQRRAVNYYLRAYP